MTATLAPDFPPQLKKALACLVITIVVLAAYLSDDKIPEAQYNWAITLLDKSDDNTANTILHLKRALEISSEYYDATAKLAEIYTRMGDDAQATLYRNKAAQLRQKQDSPSP